MNRQSEHARKNNAWSSITIDLQDYCQEGQYRAEKRLLCVARERLTCKKQKHLGVLSTLTCPFYLLQAQECAEKSEQGNILPNKEKH